MKSKYKNSNKYSFEESILILLLAISLTSRFNEVNVPIQILIAANVLIPVIYFIRFKGIVRVNASFQYYFRMCIPYVAVLVYTFCLSLFSLSNEEVYIGRAISSTFWVIVFLFTGFCFFNMSPSRSIRNLFFATSLSYISSIVFALLNLSMSDIFNYLISPEEASLAVTKYFEMHELMFSFGVLLIYYLLFENKNIKRHYLKIVTLIIFIFLGYKRIEFLAIALTIVMFVIVKKLKLRGMTILGVCMIIIALIYVYITRDGSLIDIFNKYNINVMGRDQLYNFINTYYEVSPEFLGHGWGFVEKILEANSLKMSGITSIHNDIVRIYTDCGFWGMIAWFWYQFIYMTRYANKKHNVKVARLYFCISFYMFITYMTDNTITYTNLLITFAIVMNYFIRYSEAMEKSFEEKTKDMARVFQCRHRAIAG